MSCLGAPPVPQLAPKLVVSEFPTSPTPFVAHGICTARVARQSRGRGRVVLPRSAMYSAVSNGSRACSINRRLAIVRCDAFVCGEHLLRRRMPLGCGDVAASLQRYLHKGPHGRMLSLTLAPQSAAAAQGQMDYAGQCTQSLLPQRPCPRQSARAARCP
ncbi:hypothetical protein FB451DRAFT_1246135 [Mycena latifolia]|nr:hypothetical protein FB451DRAFT_1246135 [Mycena latifolia]